MTTLSLSIPLPAWPEPLIIEVIADQLEPYPLTTQSRRSLARRHAAALRDMVADHDDDWREARSDLDELYVSLGFSRRRLATIDCAVFAELVRLVGDQHRTSPRRRCEAVIALKAALGRLPDAAGRRCAPASGELALAA